MNAKKKLPEIVLFGDSLTQWSFDPSTRGIGWVLKNKYAGKAEIVNEGVAGYTSRLLQPNFADIIARATRPEAAPTLLITIWLGANDACLGMIPLDEFEKNIRGFVEDVLIEEKLEHTKVVLITPPPINIPDPDPRYDSDGEDDVDLGPAFKAAKEAYDPKKDRGYVTYMSKKTYGDTIMQIAASYEETGRVIGLNFWKALIDAGLEDQHRLGDDDAYDENRLPGCGLKWAKAFRKGYFEDGLHLDGLAYDVLSKQLLKTVTEKWSELAPEKLGT